MRILLAIVVLAALGWGGFWFWNATLRDRALTNWLEERRAAGWVADGEVRVIGFPNRVDTVVTGLDLADPKSGWAWKAPEFRILSQSWRPYHMIAVWPDAQTIASPTESIAVTSERLVGSLVFEPNARLALDHSTMEIQNMSFAGETGWEATIGEALFSTRQAENSQTPFSYDIDFSAKNLGLPDAWISGIDRAGVLPAAIDTTYLAATVAFDRAWDRVAIEGENPALRQILISDARLAWGQLDLRGKGALGVDARGFAEGRIDLTARNWSAMLDAAEQSDLLAPGMAGTLRGALNLYARLSGDRETISLPLEFKDGRTRLGPVAIGAAPILARRP